MRYFVILLAFAAVFAAGIMKPEMARADDELGALNAQISELQGQAKYSEALPIAERLVEKAGAVHSEESVVYAAAVSRLATLYQFLGRYAEAHDRFSQALAIAEKVLGPEHSEVAAALSNLGMLYLRQGRYGDAEPRLQRSLAIREKMLTAPDAAIAQSLNNLALLYHAQGRYTEAEPRYKRALAIWEQTHGSENEDVAQLLTNLATLYRVQGRTAEAEPLYNRSLAIREKILGPEHPDIGQTLYYLALLYRDQGHLAKAEEFMKRDLAISEKALGADHPDVATTTNGLAQIYRDSGRLSEAEQLYRRAIAIYEKTLGQEHISISTALNNLAIVLLRQGKAGEAGPIYERSLGIRTKVLGAEHPDLIQSLNNLAWLSLAQTDWARAADYWKRSTEIVKSRVKRGLTGDDASSEGAKSNWQFWGSVKVANLLAPEEDDKRARLAGETFEATQWAQSSSAAAALTQMAARGAKGNAELAALVRERQDLIAEWRSKDKQLIAAKGEPPDKRDANKEKSLSDRLAAVDARLVGIDARFKLDFPDYAALVSSEPKSIAELQKKLHDDEAMILFLDTDLRFAPLPEETFIWIVTKAGALWLRSDLGTTALSREVAALRCGLDAAAWFAEESTCRALTGAIYTKADLEARRTPPFDAARAHALYKSLLGGAEDLIKGKQLLIVPSGALTQLPFQVLVTAPPVQGKPTAWLAREHALTVLPSVASLDALRARAQAASPNRKPYLAFANPLLDGPQGDEKAGTSAGIAKRSTNCSETAKEQAMIELGREYRVTSLGGSANVEALRRLMPVPQTAALVCDVKSAIGAAEDDIHLAGRATETEVKSMNEAGALASYAVVNFATHGLVAGELNALTEPGLVLTPPASGTEKDDGYLSASEVAALKLDADWVILSACNTAAGGAKEAEALSGLARAFFYAGARALLVSHWSVWENAAVDLVTGAIAAGNAGVGRAEAMRRSMLALADNDNASISHPSYWAPFVVVGEGGAAPSPTTMKGAQ